MVQHEEIEASVLDDGRHDFTILRDPARLPVDGDPLLLAARLIAGDLQVLGVLGDSLVDPLIDRDTLRNLR